MRGDIYDQFIQFIRLIDDGECFHRFEFKNIWRSWWRFRSGKRRTKELDLWQYYLESNLFRLYTDLNGGAYRHGSYQYFTVSDTKRRDIAVASIRERVVHRLVYDYLVDIFDKTLIYDAWSCRKGKGLLGAIERSQQFLRNFLAVLSGALILPNF